jgi:hypothetical protein
MARHFLARINNQPAITTNTPRTNLAPTPRKIKAARSLQYVAHKGEGGRLFSDMESKVKLKGYQDSQVSSNNDFEFMENFVVCIHLSGACASQRWSLVKI